MQSDRDTPYTGVPPDKIADAHLLWLYMTAKARRLESKYKNDESQPIQKPEKLESAGPTKETKVLLTPWPTWAIIRPNHTIGKGGRG